MELKRRGQAMVEWVLILPVTLMLTFAVCQWCLLQMQQNMVTHAAWHAARAQLVREDPWDAAAIVLAPIAGFSPNLRYRRYDIGSMSPTTEVWNFPGETSGANLPGWGQLQRSHLLNLNRLRVSLIEDDWNKVTCQVTFQAEMLFPFVEQLFADSQLKMAGLNGGQVSGDVAFPGMSTVPGTWIPLGDWFRGQNSTSLTARATVPRIDQPRAIWNLTAGDAEAVFGSQVSGPPSPFPGNGSQPAHVITTER